MLEHTTTPWIVHETDGGAVYITDNDDFSKASFAIRADGEDANAAFIVRVVNAHDALVDAVKVAQQALYSIPISLLDDGTGDNVFTERRRVANEQINAALKLAET